MNQQFLAQTARAIIVLLLGPMLWSGPQSAQAQCEFGWSAGFGVPGTDGVVGGTVTSASALNGFDDGRGAALYVGGQFDTAGQEIASNIARWGCNDGCDPCDMNCDGEIDAPDIEPFLNCLSP